MQVRGKEYGTINPKEATVKQSKLILLVSQAYDAYVMCKDEESDATYEKLKNAWKRMASSGVIVDADAVIQDIDNLSPLVYAEFISLFFQVSSEVKE